MGRFGPALRLDEPLYLVLFGIHTVCLLYPFIQWAKVRVEVLRPSLCDPEN